MGGSAHIDFPWKLYILLLRHTNTAAVRSKIFDGQNKLGKKINSQLYRITDLKLQAGKNEQTFI